jgi:rubrerythrin
MKITKAWVKKSLRNEKAANKDYLKHSSGKSGKFLKEIARDERDHRKKLTKYLKKLK